MRQERLEISGSGRFIKTKTVREAHPTHCFSSRGAAAEAVGYALRTDEQIRCAKRTLRN